MSFKVRARQYRNKWRSRGKRALFCCDFYGTADCSCALCLFKTTTRSKRAYYGSCLRYFLSEGVLMKHQRPYSWRCGRCRGIVRKRPAVQSLRLYLLRNIVNIRLMYLLSLTRCSISASFSRPSGMFSLRAALLSMRSIRAYTSYSRA